MELASLYKPKIWPQVSRSFDSGWPNTGIFILQKKKKMLCCVSGQKVKLSHPLWNKRSKQFLVCVCWGGREAPSQELTAELTEVIEAGSHEPSLQFSGQKNLFYLFFFPVKLELSCRKLQLYRHHIFHWGGKAPSSQGSVWLPMAAQLLEMLSPQSSLQKVGPAL